MHDSPIPDHIPFRTLGRLSGAALAALAVLILVGIAAAFLAAAEPERLWYSLLFNWLFWSSVAIGMVMFAVALHITEADWAWSIRRMAVGGAAFLPISYLLLLVLLLSGGGEYFFSHWLHAEGDPVIEAKRAWLNLGGLVARDLIAVGVLFALAGAFFYFSVRPDVFGAGEARHRGLYNWTTKGWRGVPEEAHRSHHILNHIAPVLGILYAVIWGIVAIDLAMSIAPHWFSTMFPVAFFWTGFHGGVAATAIAATLLRSRLRLHDFITPRQYHDLGKLVFAFSVFWMYLNWSQFIVVWYGLLPWEQEWFVNRFEAPFGIIAQAVVILVFVLPFFGLLARAPKMVPQVLAGFSVLILIGHWLERFLLIYPSLWEGEALPLGFAEIGIGLGFMGLFLASYLWFARSYPLLPSPAMLAARDSVVVATPATVGEI